MTLRDVGDGVHHPQVKLAFLSLVYCQIAQFQVMSLLNYPKRSTPCA